MSEVTEALFSIIKKNKNKSYNPTIQYRHVAIKNNEGNSLLAGRDLQCTIY